MATTAAEVAVHYVLERIRREPRIAYHFFATEALSLLCAAYAEANGLDPEAFKREFQNSLRTEAPRCRSGECALRTSEASS